MKDQLLQLKTFRSPLTGLGFALLLTVLSFSVVWSGLIRNLNAVVLLAVLAAGQMFVHMRYFLHIRDGKERSIVVPAIAFALVLIGIVVGGTVWIMINLSGRMMG